MSDPNGWPDPSRPGVPMNAEQECDHMIAAAAIAAYHKARAAHYHRTGRKFSGATHDSAARAVERAAREGGG